MGKGRFMKTYFHELSKEDIEDLFEENKNIKRILRFYFDRPPWCSNSLALDPDDYCQTLMSGNVKGRCKCCHCLHINYEDGCEDCAVYNKDDGK